MRFGVLGAVRAYGADGAPIPLGDRQRALLAALLARAGRIVPADLLAELIWGAAQPVDPVAALHSQVSRLRRALPGAEIVTEPPGYVLRVRPDDVDADRFDRLVAAAVSSNDQARALEEALGLWRGAAYVEFADSEIARLEAIRLDEARLHATERWHRALLDSGQAARSLPGLEAFVAGHPLRETAREVLMRTLYALGRQAEALEEYRGYTALLAGELGLEPSAGIRETQLRILRHEMPGAGDTLPGPPLADLQARYLTTPAGQAIAMASLGSGPPVVALPGWVSAIDVMASGRDPRSSLMQRLVASCRVTLFDRSGTGLSRAAVTDFSLDSAVAELGAVVERVGVPMNVLAMSEAGPIAVALAAARPDLVRRLVFFGTYADGPATFQRADLNAALVTLVRTHWGLGSKAFADLYRPGASDAAARHLAEVLRDSADREVAAGYLEASYRVDASGLLPKVAAPALVLHYRGDRVVPFDGGRRLAAGLPDARLVALDGGYHLPDAADLDRIVGLINGFLSS
ncbi:alpha/beta fold hydrolase [Actinoplanes sp. NPDC051861]|uniref:alpha/beta fold hydrolase n=1 Tax=Actinoplanes sp. NPDC051861 TaxID=3155170 RepID=UPI0034120C47